MKTPKILLTVLAAFTLTTAIISCSQKANQEPIITPDVLNASENDSTNYIVLLVDTENVERGNEEMFCVFANQPSGVSDKEFTTDLYKRDSVVWVAYSFTHPETDVVKVMNVAGPKLSKVLKSGNMNGNNGKVGGRVKKNPEINSKKKYKLKFNVYRNGQEFKKNLWIDPKIRVMDNSDNTNNTDND